MDALLIISHGIILSLCVLYIIYVTAFGRALAFRKTLQSLVVDDDYRGDCHHDHEVKRLSRDSGTSNSFAYLISNPVVIAQGRRVQRLDVRNQVLLGVRHLHIDLSLVPPDHVGAQVDGRSRSLAVAHLTVVPFISVNSSMTNYNLLDAIDQLYDYAKEFLDTISLWIDRVTSTRSVEYHDNMYAIVIEAIRGYVRSLPDGDKLLIVRERNEKTRDTFATLRTNDADSFVTMEPSITWYTRLERFD